MPKYRREAGERLLRILSTMIGECGGLQEDGIVGKVGDHWDKIEQGSIESGVCNMIESGRNEK